MLCCELSAQLRDVMAVGLGWMASDVAPKGTTIREPEQYPAKALAAICLLMHAYILKASRGNRMSEAIKETATWFGDSRLKRCIRLLNTPTSPAGEVWSLVVEMLHINTNEVRQVGRRPVVTGKFRGCVQLTVDEVNRAISFREDEWEQRTIAHASSGDTTDTLASNDPCATHLSSTNPWSKRPQATGYHGRTRYLSALTIRTGLPLWGLL